VGLPEYLYGRFNESELFEKRYVSPDSVEITFPEEKRNLIYIFLESMEISYLSEELGGGQEDNLIPELYDLAREHTNFSHDDDQVGGFLPVNGTTWTIGAMVAHTAGVPLKPPSDVEDWQNGYGKEGEFLPGIISLQDILADQGYYQSLMVGSVASFGGRSVYYKTHGVDKIYDLSTARKDDIVADDYFVWWGMEDKYLFEYAKQELAEISQKDQPFAFTMLTVDTHHIGGYFCEYCENEHDEQYENVMACSSKQVMEFVEWLKEQPFYENTTIIITGDHLSMDKGYFSRNVDEDYVRRNYNCFINSAVDTNFEDNRQFSALDMFPTTLAAMGCTIEGEYLGLGVNLFSGKPTLIELLGYERFDRQVSMASDYYAEKFRLEEPEEE
jgi:phosphoglycerol transferase